MRSDDRSGTGHGAGVYSLRFANLLRQIINDHFPYLRFLHPPLPGEREPSR